MKSKNSPARRNRTQRMGFFMLRLVAIIAVLPIIAILVYIIYKGAPALSWEFITGFPSDGMRSGGIWPAIVGTFFLTILCTIVVAPLGIGAAIYLSEYAADNRWTQSIRIAIISLAGIPSVVYGLFGLGLFVIFFNFGISILAGSLTLAIMTLPVIITTTEEALRAVPQSFRVVSRLCGSHPITNHTPHRSTPGIAGHHDRGHPWSRACCGRNSTQYSSLRQYSFCPTCHHQSWTQPWRCPTTST